MVYYHTLYVGMAPNKMAATFKVNDTLEMCTLEVKGLYEPYQALPNASMSNETVNFAGEHR